jgi:replicative DNA helicase
MKSSVHYSTQLEASIIHSIIEGGEKLVEQALSILKDAPPKFYHHKLNTVFLTLIKMFKENKTINYITVYEECIPIFSKYEIKSTFELIAKGTIVDDIKDACTKLIDYFIKRTLYDIGNSLCNPSDTGINTLYQAAQTISNLSANLTPSNNTDISYISNSTLNYIISAKNYYDKGELPGIPTKFYKLDNLTSGFKPGQLIVVAARPGMGKTALALSIANNISSTQSVAIFSLEMDKETLLMRIVSQITNIPLSNIIAGNISYQQLDTIKNTISHIQNHYNLIIDDEPILSSTLLKVKLRQYATTSNIKIAFIDYLQLMKTSKEQNREREIAQLTYDIKTIARDLNIPIVILSQLNREVEHRNNKIPTLADLRESGSIEQDADLVILLYRPEYYGIHTYENGSPTENTCQLIIAKQRNGPTGTITLAFNKEATSFSNL